MQKSRPKRKSGGGRKILRFIEFTLYISALLLVFAVIGVGGLVALYSRDLPSLDPLKAYTSRQSVAWNQTTQVLASDGTVIGEFYDEDRVVIGIDRIPTAVKQAIIAVEDERFDTTHPQAWIRKIGIDPIGITRAFFINLKAMKSVQGGSTITQQLAKNLFFDKERTLKRKIREMILAYRIERDFSRDEILERYLNKVFFGNHAHGIHSAAARYFAIDLQKPNSTLSVGQAAMLAGLVKAPSTYAPHRHPEAAKERQRVVLGRMAERGYIAKSDIDSIVSTFWKTFDPKKVTVPDQDTTAVQMKVEQAGFFIEYVRQELLKLPDMDMERLQRDGYRVNTTLDRKMQTAAEAAVRDGLAKLNAQVRGGGLEAALIAIDPKTGRVLAMVGGSSWSTRNQFNRAVQAKRQAGSSFKPFVYLTALESGEATLGTVLRDEVFTVEGTNWTPKNYDGSQRGPVLPRTAITHSLNIAAVRMLLMSSPERVLERVKALGIDVSNMHPYPSMALGAFEVSLLEITSAFSTFANKGTRVEPYPLVSIDDREGRRQNTFEPFRAHQTLSEEVSFLMTSILQSVVQRGTAASTIGARLGKIPAAGKTGTTDDYADAWFVGFTPDLAVGVWVGFDQRRPMGRGMTGGRAAGPIWAQFVKAVSKGGAFPERPPSVITVNICSLTGLRASPDCTNPISEYFINRTTPEDICSVHSDPTALQQFLYGENALIDTSSVFWPDNLAVGIESQAVLENRERLKAIIDAEAPRAATADTMPAVLDRSIPIPSPAQQ